MPNEHRLHGRRPILDMDRGELLTLAYKLVDALERLADRVETIELPDGSTPDTLEARMVLKSLEPPDDEE